MSDAWTDPSEYDPDLLQYAKSGANPSSVFGLLFGFHGRIGRGTFWAATLAVNAVYIAVGFAVFIIADLRVTDEELWLASAIFYLPFLWPSLAVQTKRWHDRGRPGLWVFVSVLPLIGGLWVLIECGFLPGDREPNEYGPPPK